MFSAALLPRALTMKVLQRTTSSLARKIGALAVTRVVIRPVAMRILCSMGE